MVLIIGGLGQGKLTFARENLGVTAWSEGTLGDENCVHGLHRAIRGLEDPWGAVSAWVERHPEGVVICDEVGCGVVPMEENQRAWRETVGRICCALAERASAVYRVHCGLGVRLK